MAHKNWKRKQKKMKVMMILITKRTVEYLMAKAQVNFPWEQIIRIIIVHLNELFLRQIGMIQIKIRNQMAAAIKVTRAQIKLD